MAIGLRFALQTSLIQTPVAHIYVMCAAELLGGGAHAEYFIASYRWFDVSMTASSVCLLFQAANDYYRTKLSSAVCSRHNCHSLHNHSQKSYYYRCWLIEFQSPRRVDVGCASERVQAALAWVTRNMTCRLSIHQYTMLKRIILVTYSIWNAI